MRGNKKNKYSKRICFIFDKKQLDILSSITGGSNFVSALNGEKRNINSKKKKHTKTLITVLSGWMASSYISPQILPEKGILGIHYFTSTHNCYFEPLGYVMGG